MMMRALAFALVLAAGAAWAHGDADWIRRDPTTAFCCNERDCHPASTKDVRRIDWSSWEFHGVVFTRGDGKTFPAKWHESHGDTYWYCEIPGQPPRCFFYPNEGV